ncbi:hypothetical protein ACFQY3_22790 [Paenibacillus farraposensis]|uniref:hypothetical protein n=1 Tax=Paenibacillus farraposensis TaxID=2807095 RepID=UPI003607F69A
MLYSIVDEGQARSMLNGELSKEEIVNFLYTYITGALVALCQSDNQYDIVNIEEESADVYVRAFNEYDYVYCNVSI